MIASRTIIFLGALLAVGVVADPLAAADAPSPRREAPPAEAESPTEAPAAESQPAFEASADQAAPPSPFGGSKINQRPDAISGVVELSDGTQVPGDISTTRGRDILVVDSERKKDRLRSVPADAVRSIETCIEWERMEAQWRFKTAGSPEKVYTGKLYPNRMYSYVVTLRDGSQIKGSILGLPLAVQPSDGEPRRFVLHQRHKGEVDTTLEDLVYVKAVRFDDALRRKVEDELKAAAAAGHPSEAGDSEPRQQDGAPAKSPGDSAAKAPSNAEQKENGRE